MKSTIAVIGGGAAGFFAAIKAAESSRVIILEKTRQLLSKVRISGGGRCNVTHACFDPKQLVQNYPRGAKTLLGPFSRFQPKDTMEWFESRGVKLKIEDDGRVFPTTDSSETIIHCLLAEAHRLGVNIRSEEGVVAIQRQNHQFILQLTSGQQLDCDRLLIATGSSHKIYALLQELGHTIEPPVPSLFTFNIPQSPLKELMGISVADAQVSLVGSELEQRGPLLITHWGFSGPAILKLSAWGARKLNARNYKDILLINWLPNQNREELMAVLAKAKASFPARSMASDCPFSLPRSLWKALLEMAGISSEVRWSAASKSQFNAVIEILKRSTFSIDGKSTYKEEFVTCGGVNLDEVNFKTMESRLCPGLYFAGEVLNIDGVTGGFNFQNAWTTAWIAGQAMSAS